MNNLQGTIPDNLFCYQELNTLRIRSNYNLTSQQIPDCFSYQKNYSFLQISYSHFIGYKMY